MINRYLNGHSKKNELENKLTVTQNICMKFRLVRILQGLTSEMHQTKPSNINFQLGGLGR